MNNKTRISLPLLPLTISACLLFLFFAVLPAPLSCPAAQAAETRKEDEIQLATGKAAFEQADYELASRHFLKAIELNERNWEAHYLLGLILGQQGKYIASIDHERKALLLRPGFAPAFSVLGRSLAGNQDLRSARYYLEMSCNLEPRSASNQAYLGTVLGMQKDFKAAYEAYKKSTENDPSYVNGYLGMASCLGRMGDKAGQIAMTRKACEMAPRSAVAHAKLGILLSESGDSAGAFSEGYKANVLRLQSSWNEFLGMFLTAWASVFLAFAAIFAVIFAGSKFKPQEDETLLRSFFLTFYKDSPGRFVVTDKRLVFVPESFSSWFGATRVSIQRGQIDTVNYLSTVGGGTVSVLTKDGSVHQFRMPLLVLDPLRSLLVSQGLSSTPAGEKSSTLSDKSGQKSGDQSGDSKEALKEEPAKPVDATAESTIEIVFNAGEESSVKEAEIPVADADSKPQPQPGPAIEAGSEAKAPSSLESKPVSKTVPEQKSGSEPKSKSKSRDKTKSEPKSKDSGTESKSKSQLKPASNAESRSEFSSKSDSEPNSERKSEPTSKSGLESDRKAQLGSEPKSKSASTSESESLPESAPEQSQSADGDAEKKS